MDEEILEFRLTERATFLEFLPERHDLARCISAPELLGGGFCRADEKASSSLKDTMDATGCFERLTTCSTAVDAREALHGDNDVSGEVEAMPDSPSASDLCDVYSMQSSQGSALRSQGLCKPCTWFWRPGSCTRGMDCNHCHLCPPGSLREMTRQHRKLGAKGSQARQKRGTTSAG